jgi:5-methylcytosine-specific restriction protein A
MSISKVEFMNYIKNKIINMNSTYLDINSGVIHRDIGDYPGKNHRMPSCCLAMRALMIEGDIIVEEPEKGFGANFTIRYYNRT